MTPESLPKLSPESLQLLGSLVTNQPLAALGVEQDGEPFVSMVPFSIEPKSRKIIIHVSQLAAHTRQMLANPKVSLMVVAASTTNESVAGRSVTATPRVSIQCVATQLEASSAEYQDAKRQYVQRFPESLDLFDFLDFSLFAMTPTSARFIAGFAQAMTLSGASFEAALV